MNTDTMMDQASVLEQLKQVHQDAIAYFDRAGDFLKKSGAWKEEKDVGPFDYSYRYVDYWSKLPEEAHREAHSLASRLAGLAQQIAPVIRRSPLLTDVDERGAGHALKGMRSALKFRDFGWHDAEVLHDEGSVLGLQPARETTDISDPEKSKRDFTSWFNGLVERLELADFKPADAPIGSPGVVAAGIRPDTAFIMMWISPDQPELEDACNKIKECFKRFGIKALRADDIEHEDIITQRILDEIKTAEFLIADITGERPSVYYEIGYAHALGRRVALYRKAGTRIHFDIAAYNCPEYKNLTALEDMLMKRLEAQTGGPPKGN